MNAMTRLAQEQQALLCAVMGAELGAGADDTFRALLPAGAPDGPLARRGLLAYRSHGLALARRALGAAYPVIAQLMGEENFAALAQQLWREQPPTCGDMACWGHGLADFLAAASQLAGEPFLPDVARVEWALHRIAVATDASPDPQSFARLSEAGSAEPALTLSPGVWLLASAYPVASLVHAHLPGAPDREPALAHAAALLQAGAGEHALVWRQGFRPRVRHSSAAEHALVSGLQSGQSLERALARVSNSGNSIDSNAFDFSDWLARAVQTGLVTGARLLHNTTGDSS